MKPSVDLYGIPQCDTVKKARAHLAAAGWEVVFHDFKREGVDPALLQRWAAAVGIDALLNRRGTTWRGFTPQQQAEAAHPDGARALLQAHPSCIKRPVIEWPNARTTVGFEPKDWPLLS